MNWKLVSDQYDHEYRLGIFCSAFCILLTRYNTFVAIRLSEFTIVPFSIFFIFKQCLSRKGSHFSPYLRNHKRQKEISCWPRADLSSSAPEMSAQSEKRRLIAYCKLYSQSRVSESFTQREKCLTGDREHHNLSRSSVFCTVEGAHYCSHKIAPFETFEQRKKRLPADRGVIIYRVDQSRLHNRRNA